MPALESLVRTSKNLLARFHALWTLEGLGALDAALTRELLRDAEPRMRIQALRASETLYKSGDRSFDADYRSLSKDSDVDVVIQAMLTMNVLKVADVSESREDGGREQQGARRAVRGREDRDVERGRRTRRRTRRRV